MTAIVFLYAVRSELPRRSVIAVRLGHAGLFALWQAVAARMTELWLIKPPPTLLDASFIMMFLVGGAFLLWALARLTENARRTSESVDQDVLIGFQSVRSMGRVFLLGWALGALPWQFALPAGLGDIRAWVARFRAMGALARPGLTMRRGHLPVPARSLRKRAGQPEGRSPCST